MTRLFVAGLLALLTIPAFAQTAPKFTTHNDGKHVKGDAFTTSAHTTNFIFKGSVPNFWVKLSQATPAKSVVTYRIAVWDAKNIIERDMKFSIPIGKKEAVYPLMLRPGTYTAKLLAVNDENKVYQTYDVTVTDTKGDRATGDQKAGQSKVWICRDTDDKWNALDAAPVKDNVYTWPANKTFNVMVKNNGKAFGVSFLGFVIHKQGPDGKDTDFVNECQTDMLQSGNTMWASVTGLPGMTSLPAGTYTMYVIDWGKRQINMHPGNLTEYFAKITLNIK